MLYRTVKPSLVLVVVLFASAQCAEQCCPAGQVITRGGCNDTLGIVMPPNLNCSNGRWILKDVYLNGDKLYSADATNFVFVEDPAQYCLGVSHRNFSEPATELTPSAIICFEPLKNQDMVQTTGVLSLVSVIFLILTLLVYISLPKMRDLQGLCYISLCISMSLGYFFLGVMQLNPGFTGEDCTATGFTIYFWLMATFFWMNIISINIYRSVAYSHIKSTEKKQFFYFSCYGWGGPLFFLIVALIANFAEGSQLKPGFSESVCWIKGKKETWLFFYGPVAVLVSCNIVLCALSSVGLWKHNRMYEVNRLNKLRYNFRLSLRLFLVMGLSWIFEIASFAHGESHILWTIMDLFNCLQGVVIFILLVVLRRRAIRGLAEHNFLPCITLPLAEKLSPHDEDDEKALSCDDTVEVRLN